MKWTTRALWLDYLGDRYLAVRDSAVVHHDIQAVLEKAKKNHGGYVTVSVQTPRRPHSRPTQNYFHALVDRWSGYMGYPNTLGKLVVKAQFGPSEPYKIGVTPERDGQWFQWDNTILWLVSEADYTQEEESWVIQRLKQDCLDRDIPIEDLEE